MSKKIPLQDLHYNLDVWISKTLSIPNSTFNNLPPCPYAKQAWIEDKVEVKSFDSWVDAYSTLLSREYDFNKTDVIIFAFPSEDITPSQLSSMIDSYLQQNESLSAQQILEDFKSEGKTLVHIASSTGSSELIEMLFEKIYVFSQILKYRMICLNRHQRQL